MEFSLKDQAGPRSNSSSNLCENGPPVSQASREEVTSPASEGLLMPLLSLASVQISGAGVSNKVAGHGSMAASPPCTSSLLLFFYAVRSGCCLRAPAA